MLQKIFQVILCKFPTNLEQQYGLQVALDKNALHEAGIIKSYAEIEDVSSFIGALMRNYPYIYEHIDCKFVQINVLDSPIDDSVTTNQDLGILRLYVTEYFLKHYNYDHGEIYYFKPVICYPLDKIVFGVKTVECFNWFQVKEKFTSLVKQITEGNILCHQGSAPVPYLTEVKADSFDFKDLITLDSQPFLQGLLTAKSCVILADVCGEPDISDRFKSIESTSSDGSIVASLDLMNYTSSILGVRLNHAPGIIPPGISVKINTSYKIEITPQLHVDFERELSKIEDVIDPLNTVFLPYHARKRLNMKNGAWVKISLLKPIEDKSVSSLISSMSVVSKDSLPSAQKNVRVAQICVFSSKELSSKHFTEDEMVFISPLLWFNLNTQPSHLVQPDIRLLIEPLEDFFPPYAKEVYACLIQSPKYDGKISCDSLLKKYFSIPRFICKDDIIALNSRGELDFHSRIVDEEVDRLRWPVVYFRISRVDGPPNPYGHLIVNTGTLLYQSGTKQHYVPITMETYYQLSSYHPIWNALPNGLADYVNELQDLIMPFLKLKGKGKISCNILFTGPPCCGKTTVVKAVCRCLNLHLYQVNCNDFVGESSTTIETRLRNKIIKGSSYAPCIILFKNIHYIGRETLGEDSRVIHSFANLIKDMGGDWPILVIGTAPDQKLLSNNLLSAFLHCIQMVAPNEQERCSILEDLLSVCNVGSDVSISYLAQRTAGFVLGDLCALVNQGIRNAYSRIENIISEKSLNERNEEDMILASVPVLQRDLLNALEKLQSEFADVIGAPKIPNVEFEDIGGLASVKQEILDTIQLPLEHPEILFSGLRRSGVLLYGPPGNGKTLLAKAVATQCSLNFLSVKGPELIDMYVGQSEENVRAVFNQARSAVPCVIFFDELDALAPNRGRSGDSGGVMDRVVSQLLAELDGLNKKSEVFVIGATNRPDLLDPALLRPGRFDRILYVGIPEDKPSKLSILKAYTRKFPLAKDANLEEIVDKCPPYLSGADFYLLCSDAVNHRVEKIIEGLESGETNIEDINCDVTLEDFICTLETLAPSVSPKQYEQYQAIRAKMEK